MKIINNSVFIGVVLALLVIYWLNIEPADEGAIALIVILSIGLVQTFKQLLRKKEKKNVKS